jgi:putative ATP-dependent endonuclease of the OLD family
MKVHSILVKNYGPFAVLEEAKLGKLATIIGQNDVGKSYVLKAMQLFFSKIPKIQESDVHDYSNPRDDVIIEITFNELPENIEIEDGISTSFIEEKLLDKDGLLRVRKIYPRNNLDKYSIVLFINDFQEDQFAELAKLKERELNSRCTAVGIDATRSGRSITNKSKREMIRSKATELNIPYVCRELYLTIRDDLWKTILSNLPDFVLFESDTKLGVGETTFQSQFRPIIKAAADEPDVAIPRDTFTRAIGIALQREVDKIFKKLQLHTNAFEKLIAKPYFSWDKAVSFEIFGKDSHEIEKSLEQRGAGMRRLLMVAYFQYLAEKPLEGEGNYIFAVEEPENCLHPGLQRELARSFQKLSDEGCQMIITSHSPVFAGASTIEDLALIVRNEGVAKAIQYPELNLSDIANELGIEPADQITGYNACIFVEGPSDISFFKAIASKLKEEGHIQYDFDDNRIGFILLGGESLKCWIDLRAMNRLNKNFGVVVDSDRESPHHNVPGRKLNWKRSCENDGGIFYILRKREIENYLHSDAIRRSGRTLQDYDEFSDMKALFGDNVFKVIDDMSSIEILEMDRYIDDGTERHELKEIIESLLDLGR